jgi:adenine phosphoribosyltransferase
MEYKQYIKDIPDYPSQGILFRDIQPLIANHLIFDRVISDMLNLVNTKNVEYFIGIESRGFIFSSCLALKSGVGIKLIRKRGKLPNNDLISIDYKTEYSKDSIEIQKGNGNAIIVDDVYATGGTMNSAIKLVKKAGFNVIDTLCLIDIGIVKEHSTKCLISY